MRPISEHLRSRGGSTLALDFRGHGASGGRSTVGVAEIADVAAGVHWLRQRRPDAPVVTVGFSMGGSVVLRHAGLGGDADAVVAVSAAGRWYERGTAPMRRLHLGLETRTGRAVLRWSLNTRVVPGWDLLPAAPVEVARSIGVPLLLVHGDADPYFGLEHARMLASEAPTAELWIEAGMGHGEGATDIDLLDRVDRWARSVTGAESGNMGR